MNNFWYVVIEESGPVGTIERKINLLEVVASEREEARVVMDKLFPQGNFYYTQQPSQYAHARQILKVVARNVPTRRVRAA